jgi:hypothetical protein
MALRKVYVTNDMFEVTQASIKYVTHHKQKVNDLCLMKII